MNTGLNLDGDTIIGAVAIAATLFSLVKAAGQFRAKKSLSACLWLLGACLWALVALFFLAFQLRLM